MRAPERHRGGKRVSCQELVLRVITLAALLAATSHFFNLRGERSYIIQSEGSTSSDAVWAGQQAPGTTGGATEQAAVESTTPSTDASSSSISTDTSSSSGGGSDSGSSGGSTATVVAAATAGTGSADAGAGSAGAGSAETGSSVGSAETASSAGSTAANLTAVGVEELAGLRQCPALWQAKPGTVVLMHIPRTLGSLVTLAMERQMPQDSSHRWCRRFNVDIDDINYSLCPMEPTPKKEAFVASLKATFPGKCAGFATHFDASLLAALGVDFRKVLTIATLREPVERVISHYYFNLLRLDLNATLMKNYLPANASVVDTDFSGLLRFASAPGLFVNFMTRFYAGAMGCTDKGVDPEKLPEQELLELAKRNLAKYCIIMAPERAKESMGLLANFTGWTHEASHLHTRDKVAAWDHPAVPQDVRDRIAETNHLDVQLYRYGMALFERQLANPFPSPGSHKETSSSASSSSSRRQLQRQLQRHRGGRRRGSL